ncbi:hypothetical protein [Helicobacter enhydrae]|nr:hypothetical protein [Helicobacter enhydrae]
MKMTQRNRMDKNLVRGGGYYEPLQASHRHFVGIGTQCECGKCDNCTLP